LSDPISGNYWDRHERVIVAAWEDGTIVRSSDRQQGGPPYFLERTTSDAVESALIAVTNPIRVKRTEEIQLIKHPDCVELVLTTIHKGWCNKISVDYDIDYPRLASAAACHAWERMKEVSVGLISGTGRKMDNGVFVLRDVMQYSNGEWKALEEHMPTDEELYDMYMSKQRGRTGSRTGSDLQDGVTGPIQDGAQDGVQDGVRLTQYTFP
jgi:hypothetical protein